MRSFRLVLLPVIHIVVTTVSEKVYASDEYDYIRDETASKEKKSSSRRPNIIFIFQDDQIATMQSTMGQGHST